MLSPPPRPLATKTRVPIAGHICLLALLVLLVLLLAPGPARASDEPMTETARVQFTRGVELADRGDYQGALQAFSEAYAASPNVAVLYNIGQAQVALGRPVEAGATLSRYLQEGQDQISPERRRRVEAQIGLLESLVVELEVTTAPTGAAVRVDGRVVGRTPLAEPVRVSAGVHKVTASLDDGANPAPGPAVSQGTDAKMCLPPPAPPATVERRAPPAPTRGALAVALPYVMGGAGLALAGGALGVYLWKRSEYQRWQAGETALQSEAPGSARYQAQVAENNRMAGSLTSANHAILGLGVAGGVLIAAGASLYLLERPARPSTSSVAVAWAGGRSLVAEWRYAWR